MATRGVIARVGKHEGEFAGVYMHWGNNPMNRGPLLLKILREEFKGDLPKMLVALIDEHPAGWSSLEARQCYCHPRRAKDAEFRKRPPEPAQSFTHKDVIKGEIDIEWVYIFDVEKQRLIVRDVRHDAEGIVDLTSEEIPDWPTIECGGEKENWRRCSHYAWYHGFVPKSSNISTATYLGQQELRFHDAIAFIIGGKRYTSTGSGGSAEFLASYDPKARKFPRNSWVATLKARNGKRIDFAVAAKDGNDYTPLPGVIWIYPPTRDNPNETFVGGAV